VDPNADEFRGFHEVKLLKRADVVVPV